MWASYFCHFHKTDQRIQSPIVRKFAESGTDVMSLKIFSPKNFAEILAFLTQNKAKLCKNLIITLFLRKTPIFSPKIVKNRRKL
jgi:hypothetical protein